MHRSILVVTALLIGACTGDDENPRSETTELDFEFPIEPPDVIDGWPCPPFDDVETTQDRVDDEDGDSLTDCQEDELGSDASNPDSDGDGVGDLFEVGDVLEPLDTDNDGILDLLDTDDDGDGIPTIEEDEAPMGNDNGDPRDDDYDQDGVSNYLDDDDDGDQIPNLVEEMFPAGDDSGDPRGDDFDGDGIDNFLDTDDENDGMPTLLEDVNKNFDSADDDTDCDEIPDWLDDDDDGDGILTIDEDADGDGNPANDDLDTDTLFDSQDLDEDGDTIATLDENLNMNGTVLDDDSDGDGIPNYRDLDDDGDTLDTLLEDVEALLPQDTSDTGTTTTTTDTATTTTTTTTDTSDTGTVGYICPTVPLDPSPVIDDDSDGDGRPNYLDDDDDDDGCPTAGEDYDDNTTVLNDDTDEDGIPDFLDPDVSSPCDVPIDTGTVPTGPTTYNLQLTGTMFTTQNGEPIVVAVVRDSDSMTVATEFTLVAADMWSVAFPGLLEDGESYTVDFFHDPDMSMSCDTLTEDSWRIAVPAVTADQALSTDPATNIETAACATFP